MAAAPRQRGDYSQDKKQLVREHYQHCITRDEKIELARKIGIKNPEKNLHKLYNLASREKATRNHADYEEEYGPVGAGETKRPSTQSLQTRQLPENTHFSRKDDEYIRRHFGGMPIGDIAAHRGHTESAVMYRARHLRGSNGSPLRRPSVGYYLHKVNAWLGLNESEAGLLRQHGVEIRPLPDLSGKVDEYWVHTVSLANFLKKNQKVLVEKRNADKFFILDVMESAEDIAKGRSLSEDCYFLEHGHTCVNQQAPGSCGWFCDGNDPKCEVKDLRP